MVCRIFQSRPTINETKLTECKAELRPFSKQSVETRLQTSSLSSNWIKTTSPLAANDPFPPYAEVAKLGFPRSLAVRLPDDPDGNARWVSAENLAAIQHSRFQPPLHPVARKWRKVWAAELKVRRTMILREGRRDKGRDGAIS